METSEALMLIVRFLAAIAAGGAIGYYWMRTSRYGENLEDALFLLLSAITLLPPLALVIIEAGHLVLFGTIAFTQLYADVLGISTTARIIVTCVYSTVITGLYTTFFLQD